MSGDQVLQDPSKEYPSTRSQLMSWMEGMSKDESPEVLVDVMLHVIAKYPQEVDTELLNQFLTQHLTGKTVPSEILMSENVLRLIHESSNKSRSWIKYEIFLTRALILGVLSPSSLEDAVLPLLKNDMSNDLLNYFASCLKSVVESYKKNKSSSYTEAEFLDILDWVAWFCSARDEDF